MNVQNYFTTIGPCVLIKTTKVQNHNVIDCTNIVFENNFLRIQKFEILEIKHNSQMAELGYRSMDYIVVKMKQHVEEKNNNTQS